MYVCGGGGSALILRLVHEHHVHGSFGAWGLQCIGFVTLCPEGSGAWRWVPLVPSHPDRGYRRPLWGITASFSKCAACD